jgi:hypothetical protein
VAQVLQPSLSAPNALINLRNIHKEIGYILQEERRGEERRGETITHHHCTTKHTIGNK